MLLVTGDSRTCNICMKGRRNVGQNYRRGLLKKKVKRLSALNPLKEKVMKNRVRSAGEMATGAKKKIRTLEEEIGYLHRKMELMSRESILSACERHKDNIPSKQLELIEEIVKAAQCRGPNGRRYSEDWMLTCVTLIFSIIVTTDLQK